MARNDIVARRNSYLREIDTNRSANPKLEVCTHKVKTSANFESQGQISMSRSQMLGLFISYKMN